MLYTDLDRAIDLMVHYDVSAEQWLFLQLLWAADKEEGGAKYLYKYFMERNLKNGKPEGIPTEAIKDLYDRDFIKVNSSSRYLHNINPDEFEVNKRHAFFIDLNLEGMEFFNCYPAWKYGEGGKKFPMKNIGKEFQSLPDFLAYYGKQVLFDPNEHRRNMDALRYVVEQDDLPCGIVEWVKTKKWNDYQPSLVGDDI